MALIQKFILEDVADASPIQPAHVAICDKDGNNVFGNAAKALSKIEGADAAVSGKNGLTKADAEALVALVNEIKAAINQAAE